MTQEKFKDLIEVRKILEKEFWTKIVIGATIARTVRLTLEYPGLAQEYLDSLPKAVNDSEQPTPTNS